jgi:hypothetical protein
MTKIRNVDESIAGEQKAPVKHEEKHEEKHEAHSNEAHAHS